MSKMGDFVIEIAELYLDKHPDETWERAMAVITSDCEEAQELEKEVLERRGIEA